MLPPLSAPPPSPPAAHADQLSGAALAQNPRVEQLLIDHVRFAHAFKQNDAAKILPFLHKDVALTTTDGARLAGLSAVLAHLVGPRMAKLSSHMRVKGSPARAGPSQSKLLYEHGLLFRQDLYVEVIDWTPDHTIAAITHVAVAASDSKGQSSSSSASSFKIPPHIEILKSSSASAAPLSSMPTAPSSTSSAPTSLDSPLDEEEPEHQHLADDLAAASPDARRAKTPPSACLEKLTTASRRLSRARSSSDSSSRFSTCSSSGEVAADVTLKIQTISCADLSPIRSRKHVNAFVTIRKSPRGHSHWKSSVARHERNPMWTHVPVELHSLHGDDILEISLWDFTLFRSTKVATAALVLADLFAQDEDEFTTTIQLERMELTDTQPPIQLTMKLNQKTPVRVGQSASVHPQAAGGALDATTLLRHASSSSEELLASTSTSSSAAGLVERVQWFIQDSLFGDSYSRGTSMLLRALFGLVLVWLISRVDFDKVESS